ncbi:MAG: TonB-dependent receptor [Pseudomonadales bacterium]|nr:TonB-dependent receptor [Pseudomonadales bacterium]
MNKPVSLALAVASVVAAMSGQSLAADAEIEEITVIGKSTVYANNAVSESMQALQTPITSSLSLIDNLPGLSIQEGDTYGFDDWSTTISMRGFQVSLAEQQIGITIDGLPNGNSNYGGGAKANRYIDNQNVAGVNVSQGTADIKSRSNEALGGTLDFLTLNPAMESGFSASMTSGEFDGKRYFVRYDTGEILPDTFAWISVSHQEATDWVNGSAENVRDHYAAKIRSDFTDFTLTGYLAYDDTHEDNYQRIFSPADFAFNPRDDQLTADWTGIPYIDQLYRKGWSTLRENLFSYGKIDWNVSEALSFTGSVYYHSNEGRGDWVPPYIVDVTNDGAQPESELSPGLVLGGSPLGRIYFVDASGHALTPTSGCVSSITFPYGGAGPEYDPACYPAGAIPVQSYRHTHYEKQRTGFTGDIEFTSMIGDMQNTVRAGIWWEDYLRGEYRSWHKINDTRVGYAYNDVAYWRQYDREYPQETFKWYLEDTLELGVVSLNVGIKQFLVDIERDDLFGATTDVSVNSDSDVLISGGAIWRTPVEGLELFGGYAENFSSISDNILERPDSDLSNIDPETATNIDLGARYRGESFSLTATYYDVEFDNRIIFLSANTSAGPDYLIGTNGTYFNAGGVDSSGLELTGTWNPVDELEIYFSYTNNDSSYIGTGDPLVDSAIGIAPGSTVVNMPETMYVAAADWHRGPFSVGFSSKFTDDRYVNVGNTWKADSYTLTDAYLSYSPEALPDMLRGMNVTLNINNVTDEEYIAGISGGGAWLGAPRTVAVTFQLDLGGE